MYNGSCRKHLKTVGGGGGDGHDVAEGSKMNYGCGDNATGARSRVIIS